MGSLGTGKSTPAMIDYLRKSFRERDYIDVQDILMDREKKMRMEMKNLEKELLSAREEVRLMEKTQGLAEIEKMRLEEKLKISRSNCEVLKTQKIEAEKAAEFHRKKVDDFELRIKKMEEAIAGELNVKVGDFDKLVKLEEDCANSDDLRGKKGSAAAECNHPPGFEEENEIEELKGEGSAQADCNPPPGFEEEIKIEELQGEATVDKNLSSVAGCSSKRVLSSSSPALDIIELSDSDDEPTNKHKNTESKWRSLKNATSKGKRSMSRSDSDDDIPIIKRRYCNLDSTDSEDESFSDTCMENFVAGMRDENRFKRALNEDDEFCMNAVCALYRQQINTAKSKSQCGSSLSKIGGFIHFDLMSGSDLAEYLIDDYPNMKFRKSACQVKDQWPEVIDQCRKLATYYKENLYTIYSTEEDPFFSQTKP